VLYRGVPVAEVTQVTLSEDQRSVEVRARVQRSASSIAREGSVFWIVRPEVGIGQITGLSTVITGPEIQVLPGKGEARYEFTGLDNAPAALDLTGLKIILRASRLGSPQRNSPVYFRGVEVGVVQETDLSSDATSVDLHVVIRQRYARLVRTDSVFWNVSGAHVSAGLFKGLDFRMESLKALAAGGIAFASAGDPGAKAARQGQVFPLYADARKEWLDWNAPIRIPSQKGAEPAADPAEAKAHPPKAPKEARPKVGPDTSRVPWSAGG
jgi:paraquat-inducible protein B